MDRRNIDLSSFEFGWAAGIEDTFIPQEAPGLRALEEYELTQHYSQWREDLDRAASLGIRYLRWGIPWYKVEPERDRFDWKWVDEVLDYMVNTLHIEPILDLMHYGTPFWLKDSFVDKEYPTRVARYAEEVARRYNKLVRFYTPLNEPTVNAEFCCKVAQWPPYLLGWEGYVRVMMSISRGVQKTIQAIRSVQPDAIFVAVEAMHAFHVIDPRAQADADLSFYKDFVCWDLTRGAVGPNHPVYPFLKQYGATEDELKELAANGVEQDIFGVNFYPWSSYRVVVDADGKPTYIAGPNDGRQLADVIKRVHDYVRKPIFITETSCPGDFNRRALWMAETIDAVRVCITSGIPVIGYTWFPMFTMIDWAYRTSQKPIQEHLLHLGLWDAQFDARGVLVRHSTPLVETYQDWIKRGMHKPIAPASNPVGTEKCQSWLARWWRRLFGASRSADAGNAGLTLCERRRKRLSSSRRS